MDNITHTLVGVIVGDFVGRAVQKNNEYQDSPKSIENRSTLILAAVIASNLPDFDFIIRFFSKDRLIYLINHRGITHNFFLALLFSLLILLAIYFYVKQRKLLTLYQRQNWLNIFLVSILSIWIHIFCDYWNSYGVRPFWPFSKNWIYGDFVFILDPLILSILIPSSFYLIQGKTSITKFFKWFLVFIFIALNFLSFKLAFVPKVFAFITLLVGIINWRFVKKLKKNFISKFALSVLCFLLLIQFIISKNVKKEFSLELQDQLKNENIELKILDIGLMPMPSNFICWNVIALLVLQKQNAESLRYYTLVKANFSFLSKFFDVAKCPHFDDKNFDEQEELLQLNSNQKVYFLGTFKRNLKEFFNLKEKNCAFKRFLEFSRFPIWNSTGFSDFRFIRKNAPNFSSFSFNEFESNLDCSKNEPRWVVPSLELLNF
jgi:inner membrane protein